MPAPKHQVQRRCWEMLRDAGFNQHPLIEPAAGSDAIVKTVLAAEFSLEARQNREKLTDKVRLTYSLHPKPK